jgi:hypothetical protein
MYTGNDPCDDPQGYLHWYCDRFDGVSDIRDEFNWELLVVLVDCYNEKRFGPLSNQLGDSMGLEEFTRQLMLMDKSGNESSK